MINIVFDFKKDDDINIQIIIKFLLFNYYLNIYEIMIFQEDI
jgi:hypothetical protein